ncbi:MAG TPA: hypothetical protein VN178_11430 [Rubrobacter sp.]|jgi:hypothetical protein|nr:hypothetical protein [Rubrobacter sp.]
MPDRELERELKELGGFIDYPPTPDAARAARRVLDEENSRPRRFLTAFPAMRWVAVAAAFVLVVAVPTLSPGLRATIGDWFVAEGVHNAGEPAVDAGSPERQTEAAAPSAGVSKSGESLAARFSGERITLQEARARMEGALLLPRIPNLGKPDEVYAAGTSEKNGVVLVYRDGLPPLGGAGISLVLTETPGDVESAYLGGKSTVGSELERVSVDGDPGYWGSAGRIPSAMDPRLPGGVLLWEKGGYALRLEADLHKEQAIRIAESVR